jgi:peptide deformylase
MTRLTILEYPDARLRIKARPVQTFDAELSRVIDDLFDTLYSSGGLALAATQVDIHRQILVADLSGSASAPQVFVNPRILRRGAVGLVEESCLSVPGMSGNVKRAVELRVRSANRTGDIEERDLEGMLAVCVQHEMDHLEGRLFVDRLPFMERLRFRFGTRGTATGTYKPAG